MLAQKSQPEQVREPMVQPHAHEPRQYDAHVEGAQAEQPEHSSDLQVYVEHQRAHLLWKCEHTSHPAHLCVSHVWALQNVVSHGACPGG